MPPEVKRSSGSTTTGFQNLAGDQIGRKTWKTVEPPAEKHPDVTIVVNQRKCILWRASLLHPILSANKYNNNLLRQNRHRKQEKSTYILCC